MPAYVIGKIKIRDAAWATEYRSKVPALIAKHGGRYLVRLGKMEKLEGHEPLPTGHVVIEFPSMDAARSFYQDPEYAPMIALRQAGSDLELELIDGV